jgi:hypothetical protein
MRLKLPLFLFVVFIHVAEAFASDSLKRNVRTWVFTPRFNTLNMAPVSGNIVNNNINLDLSLVYTMHRFMWTVVNGVDLEDQHSEMNYLFTNVRYKINVTKHLGFSPFLAYYSEHAHQLFDPISDFNGGMIFSFQRGPLTIELFTLLVRLTHKTTEKDLINRLEIRYKLQSILVSGFVFQNTEYFDKRRRSAIGFKVMLPEFKILNKINARTEVTGSYKIAENPETKNLNGIFLSLAFPIRS